MSVGFSTFLNNILDPTVPGIHIRGQGPCTGNPACVVEDLDIITNFVELLATDPDGLEMMGDNTRIRYITGYSNSSVPLLKLVNDGRAEGHFDFVLPFVTGPFVTGPSADGCFHSPQCSIATGKFSGLVIVQNSEFDDREITPNQLWQDNGTARNNYRYFVEPGTPHVVDYPEYTNLASRTTPATYRHALHARFLQGHYWVHLGRRPPPSNQLARDDLGTVLLDENQNAYAKDTNGKIVPRLPFVELGEAHFIMGNPNIPPPLPGFLLGSYDNVRSAEELFGSYKRYLVAYLKATLAYALSVRLDIGDTLDLLERATLCPPLTYTETYQAEYESHSSMEECEP